MRMDATHVLPSNIKRARARVGTKETKINIKFKQVLGDGKTIATVSQWQCGITMAAAAAAAVLTLS